MSAREQVVEAGRPERIEVSWARLGPVPRVWYPLESLDVAGLEDTAGVYVIWHEGLPSRTIAVGQSASIKERLSAYRSDEAILAYGRFGTLRASWAAVPDVYRDGVERYLADLLQPLVGDGRPDAAPIAVNW